MDAVSIFSLVKDILLNTFSITALVMVMLLLIEFINVFSSGKLMNKFKHRPLLQIPLAAVIGLIPGCIGGFAVVSLFTHKLCSFAALVAGMISGFGDEAFVMLAFSPKWTAILGGILLLLAIIVGFIIYFFSKKESFDSSGHSLPLHDEHDCAHHHDKSHASLSFGNLKKPSFHRAVLLVGIVLYIIFLLSGTLAHQHAVFPAINIEHNHEGCNDDICQTHHHDHDHAEHSSYGESEHGMPHGHDHGVFSWENIVFLILALFTLVIVAFTSEHFLVSHLWEHVIKQHFLSVFLWTFGVLLIVQLGFHFVDVNALLVNHQWAMLVMLLLALLIGLIPESGPHLVFVVMFFSGTIPFSILLANSIVQEGHGALPLLADSRKNFVRMKLIKVAVALIVGFAGFILGF